MTSRCHKTYLAVRISVLAQLPGMVFVHVKCSLSEVRLRTPPSLQIMLSVFMKLFKIIFFSV